MPVDYTSVPVTEAVAALAEEEDELTFATFDYDDAWAVGTWLRDAGLREGLPIAIAIMIGQQRVFHAALPGSAAVNDAWLERKFRTVAHYNHSTLAVRYDFILRDQLFAERSRLDPLLYADAGGGFPLRVQGLVVGAVGVSGLEMHADHALVVSALRARICEKRNLR